MRALVVLIPLGAGFGVAVLVGRLLGTPHGVWPTLLWWVAVIGGSIVAVVVADSQMRRLLPLEALLRLSLVFPDRAPSRFRVALKSGSVRRLHELARSTPDGEQPAEAAQRILVLAGALAHHDPMTRGHSERVRAYTDLLAEELGLSEDESDRLRWSALLHDVGKLTVPHDLLRKTGPLDAEEWEAVRRHPDEGARIAQPLRKWLGPWALAIAQHHERWDGSGYPRGLAGNKISRGARIVAVADAFDVMTAIRSYRDAVRPEEARAELAACAGRDFDPKVVRAFLDISLGRIRWALGLGTVLAVPLLPRNLTRPLRNVSSAGLAAVTAVALGVLPIGGPAAVSTHVLAETFHRSPSSGPATSVQPELPSTTTPTTPDIATTTTVAWTTSSATTTPATLPSSLPNQTVAAAGALPTGASVAAAPTTPSASTTSTLPVAGPPLVAVPDAVTAAGRGATHVLVLANDQPLPGATLVPKTLRIAVAPAHGKAHVEGGGRIHYQPAKGYAGLDSLVYSICDDAGRCFSAVLTITVR